MERGPMTHLRKLNRAFALKSLFTLAGPVLLTCSAAPALAQTPRPPAFLAQHYDVTATLDPIAQSLSAVAKVEFKAQEVSGGVRVELHPNLDVRDVKSADGKSLSFERDSGNTLFLTVLLPSSVSTGTKVTLTFTYAGLLANEDNSPIPGVKTAVISKEGAYLLLPARWFPLTNFPSNRYTGTFRLNVPDSFAVAGTGKASTPTPQSGGRLLYTFQCTTPTPSGPFVAGDLQLSPQQAE